MLSIHFDEIALKGNNRGFFVKKLIESIRYLTNAREVEFLENRIIIKDEKLENTDKLDLLPGVAWYGDVEKFYNLEDIISWIKEKGMNFDIDVKRIDKSKPFTSLDIKNKLREFSKGNQKIVIEIFSDFWLLNYNIKKGIGGLPIGTAGQVINLFSGGVDSSVATIELMKRGAKVDLVHVYTTSSEAAINGKIGKFAAYISNFEDVNLFLLPSKYIYLAFIDSKTKYELQIFKHFLLLIAQEIAKKYNYLAISSGDSLSQVASQTLQNLFSINKGLSVPVFRPLITRNKSEIIDLAHKYRIYDISSESYKDFCSLVAKHPLTKSDPEKLMEEEKRIKLEDIIKNTLDEMEIYRYRKGNRELITSV